jgi:hypothetical protein
MAAEPRRYAGQVKERGILYSGDMVRALLAGQKTQTRRIANVSAVGVLDGEKIARMYGPKAHFAGGYKQQWAELHEAEGRARAIAWCPYGVIGDRLWVRETFALIWPGESEPEHVRDNLVEYRADKPSARYPGEWDDCPESRRDSACPKWRPSIHMPRWASRITLEITDVRIERLQDISELDAQAEGVTLVGSAAGHVCFEVPAPYGGPMLAEHAHRWAFSCLWEKLYGASAPWSSNPWVWVISFVRVPA